MDHPVKKLSLSNGRRTDFSTANQVLQETQAKTKNATENPETTNPRIMAEMLKPFAASQEGKEPRQRIPKVTSLGKRPRPPLDAHNCSQHYKRLKDGIAEHINRWRELQKAQITMEEHGPNRKTGIYTTYISFHPESLLNTGPDQRKAELKDSIHSCIQECYTICKDRILTTLSEATDTTLADINAIYNEAAKILSEREEEALTKEADKLTEEAQNAVDKFVPYPETQRLDYKPHTHEEHHPETRERNKMYGNTSRGRGRYTFPRQPYYKR